MKQIMKRNRKHEFTLKNRFLYWFDNRMSKNSLGLIRVLIAATVLLALLIAGLIVAGGFHSEGSAASILWNSISTLINAQMPYFEEGGIVYLILMTIVAAAGVLFTSVLIGIITSAIEARINNLKRGDSLVLESGHIVVLGFYPGEYALLRQLILAAAERPTCVVVAENLSPEEMEQGIEENLDLPKNFRIVCRTADITDPASLEKCSVETCKTVIVAPTDDARTIKAILAVSALLEEKGVPEISVNAIISGSEYRFPQSIAETNNITTLQTEAVMAKMIAHSCTQTGLSETFREVFNFEGSEFYLTEFPDIAGLTFEDLMLRVDDATPVGVYRDGTPRLNPPAGYVLQRDDRVLVFAEEKDSAVLLPAPETLPDIAEQSEAVTEAPTSVVIIGCNRSLPTVLRELPNNVTEVCIAVHRKYEDEREALEQLAASRGTALRWLSVALHSEEELTALAKSAEHIVVLNDHSLEQEKADLEVIFLLLHLRDIRKRCGLRFNITVEMQEEHNQMLVNRCDHTDFLVASSTASLILAQLAESPELLDVFREILSNEGNELYLQNAGRLHLTGAYTVRDLRRILLHRGLILLGWLDEKKNSVFNPPQGGQVTLTPESELIVLGEYT